MKIFNKILAVIGLIFLSFVLSGYVIHYRFWDFEYKNINTVPIKVAILTFRDNRPMEERYRKYRKETDPETYLYYTTDDCEPYYQDMMKVFTRRLVKHFQHAKIFKRVTHIEDLTIENAESWNIPDKILKEYDAILTGKIKHFYGYSTCGPDLPGAASPHGLVGYMIKKTIEKDKKEGYAYKTEVELEDIKLIDIRNKKKIWEGNIKASLGKENVDRENCIVEIDAVCIAAANAIDSLIYKLSEVDTEEGKDMSRSDTVLLSPNENNAVNDPSPAMTMCKLADEYKEKGLKLINWDKTSMVHEGWEDLRKATKLYEDASKIATLNKDLGYIYYHWAIALEWMTDYLKAWQKVKLARKYDKQIIESQFIKKLSRHLREPDNAVEMASVENLGLAKQLFLTLSADKSNTYSEDPVTLSVKLYVTKLNLYNIQLPSLLQNGLSKAEFKEPRQFKEKIDGLFYDVLEFNTKICGAKPGFYKVGPAKIDCYVLTGNPKQRYEAYSVELKSQEIDVGILPPDVNRDKSQNDRGK